MADDTLGAEAIERARTWTEIALAHSGTATEDAVWETILALINRHKALEARAAFLEETLDTEQAHNNAMNAEIASLKAERERLIADLDAWKKNAEYACENPATDCECPGCSQARADHTEGR